MGSLLKYDVLNQKKNHQNQFIRLLALWSGEAWQYKPIELHKNPNVFIFTTFYSP